MNIQIFMMPQHLRNAFFSLINVLLILLLVDFYVPDSYPISDYIRGSWTETLGIIITVFIIDRIISAQRKKDEKSQEMKQIIRLDKLLQIQLKKSIQYASYMTQQPQPIDNVDYEVSKNFDFNRLVSFDMSSLFIFDGSEQSYVLFEKSIEKSLTIIREAIVSYNFSYFPEVEKILLHYMNYMSSELPFLGLASLDKDSYFKPLIKKMIQEIPSGTIPTYAEYPSNILQSFIRIYHIIDFHIDFINMYNLEISKVFGYSISENTQNTVTEKPLPILFGLAQKKGK